MFCTSLIPKCLTTLPLFPAANNRIFLELEKHHRELDPYSRYLQWFEGQVEDRKRTLSFFYRNVLDCVRYLLHQIAYQDEFVYPPRREYDHTEHWVYPEMHTADWWWDIQVESLDLFPGSAD